jgi:hypothetical protein
VRQALHIFKKDARYLRWELGALLVFMGTFVYSQIRVGPTSGAARSIVFLLGCLWAFVCARLIQAETIPGDRQFWITRPYEWQSLLSAKLLFVLVLISIPLLIADAVVLAIAGFSIAANLAGLLWSVFLVTAGLLLAFCAFATLMRGLTQWVLSAIVIVGGASFLDVIGKGNVWGGVDWIRDHGGTAILLLAASIVLLWQYKRRRTAVSIAVMAVGLAASWLYGNFAPAAAGVKLQILLSKPKVDPSPIRMVFRARTERAVPHSERWLGGRDAIALAIPVDVFGLGEGLELISDGIQTTIELEDGKKWSVDDGIADHHLEHSPSGYREILHVNRAVYEKAKNVSIRSTLYLTLLGPGSKPIQLGIAPVHVPGVGLCSLYADDQFQAVRCRSAMRAPSNLLLVKLGIGGEDRTFAGMSYSPLPADSSISPLHWYWHPASANDSLISLEPLAHFRRDIELRGINLEDYQAIVPRYF